MSVKTCTKCGTKGKPLNPLTEYADGWRCKWCQEYWESIRRSLEKQRPKPVYKEESADKEM